MISINIAILTCACFGIHKGRVEPASLIQLTISRTEALQARQSCASSLETFTQSFLDHAWPTTRGPQSCFRSPSIVVAHVFSWPPACLRLVRGSVRRRSLIGMTKAAEPSLYEQCQYPCKAEAATQVHGWYTIFAPYA